MLIADADAQAVASKQVARLGELLQSATKPMSFAQLAKATHRSTAELQSSLTLAVEQGVLFRWPDYRKSQYFWWKSADEVAQDAVLTLASQGALSRSELSKRSRKRVPGFPEKAMDRIISNLVASRALQPVPAFTSGKLLIRTGHVAAYAVTARKFLDDKFRKAGLGPIDFSPTPAVTQQAEPTPEAPRVDDIGKQILDLVRSIEPNAGVPVTTQRLRQRLPALTKEEFDAGAVALHERREVSLSLHHDPHNLSQADRDLLVDGRDGNYYVAIALRR